jgi:ArsR family transcriptional regulator, zinc-responsive transcriptional repressor
MSARAKSAAQPALKLMSLEELACACECMKVLAHPVRLRIVEILTQGRFAVNEVAEMCDLAPARACEHLRLMKGHGLLDAERKGQNVYYRIASPRLPSLLECVQKHCGVSKD